MRQFKYWLMAIVTIMTAGLLSACGGDDPEDNGEDENTVLFGTWYSNEKVGLDQITFEKKRLSGIWRMDSGRPVPFSGTYVLDGKEIDFWVTLDGESDKEYGTCKVIALSKEALEIIINYDGETEYYTLTRDKKDNDTGGTTDPDNDRLKYLCRTWRGEAPSWDNEYIYSITFKRDGGLYGRFLEGNGAMSDFTGQYRLYGESLDITLIFEDENEQDIDHYEGKIIRLTSDELWYQLEDEDNYIYRFIRE